MNTNTRLAPEMLVSRLGDYLVEKGMISKQDLQRALVFQQSQRDSQQQELLGKILVDMGILSREDLDQAVTEQILQLRTALEEANRSLEQRVKKRTLELQLALEKLSELNQLKSNFVANISHELRTPLTHLNGYLELMIASDLGPLTEDQMRALNTMKRAAVRLERLIEDMIQFSTMEQGTISLKLKPFHISSVCLNVLAQHQPRARERKLTLHYQPVKYLQPVIGDEEKITWVISQLVDNAIKFTPEGGTIHITTQQGDKITLVSIQDTGIGISEKKLGEIFEPFHQLDSSSTRRYGGTGLGLSLARKIIEAHGSAIRARSQPQSGSVFEFTLKTVDSSPGVAHSGGKTVAFGEQTLSS